MIAEREKTRLEQENIKKASNEAPVDANNKKQNTMNKSQSYSAAVE